MRPGALSLDRAGFQASEGGTHHLQRDGDKTVNPITGTVSSRGISTATNWDPFGSRELVIKFHCTTDITKASKETVVTYG